MDKARMEYLDYAAVGKPIIGKSDDCSHNPTCSLSPCAVCGRKVYRCKVWYAMRHDAIIVYCCSKTCTVVLEYVHGTSALSKSPRLGKSNKKYRRRTSETTFRRKSGKVKKSGSGEFLDAGISLRQ